MKNYFVRIQKIIQFLIRAVQRFLLTVFLTILYFFGLGITLFLLMLFNRKALVKKNNSNITFWDKAEGYDADINNSIRQS